MATVRDISQTYALRFVRAIDKKRALDEIIAEINGLVYEDTNDPINYQTKVEIVETIRKIISRELPLLFKDGGEVINIRHTDNEKFLDMVNYVLGQLKR